jgi:hypothetical protein
VVNSNDRGAARLQYSVDLLDGTSGVWSMMNCAERVDEVERFVGKPGAFSVSIHWSRAKSFELEVTPCLPKVLTAQVQRHH